MKKLKIAAWLLCAVLLFSSCGTVPGATASEAAIESSSEVQSEQSSSEAEVQVPAGPKQVIVYFPNWNLDDKDGKAGGEVASIPWDKVTYINHAFWKVSPTEGEAETSFARRADGKDPRTDFALVSTNPKMDLEDAKPSVVDSAMQRNHFAEYAAYSEKYPDVNIMISVGGWTACGYFSEMAYTPEGRASFIKSCLDLMEKYPWIDGIDLDWEHPGGSNDGERKPEDEKDQGCPIWGTAYDDRMNFTALCSEMRAAFTEKYGEGVKKLTACASASTGWTLPNQDWVSADPYLDYINIMTYDLAGKWDSTTGHASSVNGAKGAMVYFMQKKIKPEKFTIGTPLYSTVFKFSGEINPKKVVGAGIDKEFVVDGNTVTQTELAKFESEAVSGFTTKLQDGKVVMDAEFDKGGIGWHYAYDSKVNASYMYNDDPASEYYKWYISYESPLSLQAKLDTIQQYNLAGIIVWEVSQDKADHTMVNQMAANLLK